MEQNAKQKEVEEKGKEAPNESKEMKNEQRVPIKFIDTAAGHDLQYIGKKLIETIHLNR
jgi:hypothetical protein